MTASGFSVSQPINRYAVTTIKNRIKDLGLIFMTVLLSNDEHVIRPDTFQRIHTDEIQKIGDFLCVGKSVPNGPLALSIQSG